MDLTEKSGQPSMEEILASIRRIIAEEPADAIFLAPKASAPTLSATQSTHDADDAMDFQLPSMFRPASPQISENATVAPVRLTDALKLASAASDLELKPNGNGSENYSALSSLKPLAQTIHATAVQQPVAMAATPVAPAPVVILTPEPVAPVLSTAAQIPAPFAPAPSAPETVVARKMASFSDNRFKSISAPTAVLKPEPEMPVVPEAIEQPVEVAHVSPLVLMAPLTSTAPVVPAQPTPDTKAAGGGVEDQTAELLRPMLRQWLTENMPRMVEKALFMEVNTTNGQKKD
jgi:uncharacterized protein